MPLSLIRIKKKDGLKKGPVGPLIKPGEPDHEVINLTKQPNPMMTISERPSSQNSLRLRQPRLGIAGMSSSMFDEDTGIMSEAETSSTSLRRSDKFRASLSGSGRHPMLYSNSPMHSPMMDDDPGIMSEAETSSTARFKRSTRGGTNGRNSIPMGSLTLNRASGLFSRSHGPPPYQARNLLDDDPGIMSEAETSSTGRRRNQNKKSSSGNKSALPVVRTPSKTLERPLGLVFLIYRGETKRALLPNEITSKDTVKALFVRSFGKTLTMEYLDSPRVRMYVHDSSKDIFYELENLDEIKDRSILKLFEADSLGRGPGGLGPGGLPPITNKDEVHDEFMDNPVAKNLKNKKNFGTIADIGRSTTLPRNAFSSLMDQGKLNGPPRPVITVNPGAVPGGILRPESALGERSKTLGPGFMRGYRSEAQNDSLPISPESVVGGSRFSTIHEGRYYSGPGSTEEAKARMMHMEAQLSQLTGMVEKALKNKKAGGKKTVSFEKSVTFSDDPPSSSRRSSLVASTNNSSLLSVHTKIGSLQRTTRDLRQEVRVLRRLTQLQSMAMKDLVQDTYLKLKEACIAFSTSGALSSRAVEDLEYMRISTDEEAFTKEFGDLLNSLGSLEIKVEEMRNGVISKKNKISIGDVERMAVALSTNSKAVTQFKLAFPSLETHLKGNSLKEDFVKKTPEKLDNAWRRCKKLTGTLVTLKRLASVQEQRFNPGPTLYDVSLSPTPADIASSKTESSKDNSLDELLNALQNYKDEPKKMPVPAAIKTNAISEEESDSEVFNSPAKKTAPNPPPRGPKAAPPPPPPRTSSSVRVGVSRSTSVASETSSSSESINSQEGVNNHGNVLRKANSLTGPPVPMKPLDLKNFTAKSRQDVLESRHQELLTRQKQLQEQYQRLQIMQENKKNKQQQKPVISNGEVKAETNNKKVPPPLPDRNPATKVTAMETSKLTDSLEEKQPNNDDSSTKVYETDIV